MYIFYILYVYLLEAVHVADCKLLVATAELRFQRLGQVDLFCCLKKSAENI